MKEEGKLDWSAGGSAIHTQIVRSGTQLILLVACHYTFNCGEEQAIRLYHFCDSLTDVIVLHREITPHGNGYTILLQTARIGRIISLIALSFAHISEIYGNNFVINIRRSPNYGNIVANARHRVRQIADELIRF